jgi:uncharacterized membrane protein YeaQ/YmgE (transglycosylase-associated protein family)
MKYIIVLFWSIILGNLGGFIVSSLQQENYNIPIVSIVSAIIGLLASFLIPNISKTEKN